MIKKKILLGMAMLCGCLTASAEFDVTALRVEYTKEPLGIDVAAPRFSWQMKSDKAGAAQTAYQINVKDAEGKEMWNSGRVKSGDALGIKYQGESLKPSTRYSWTVTVFGNDGTQSRQSSWFETGLMSLTDKDAAWGGAKWIGGNNGNALTFYSQYLPVFRLKWGLTLDKRTKSTHAGFIYGANDHRLLDCNKNILGVENKSNRSYIRVELNTEGLSKNDSATIEIYRVGYTLKDKNNVPLGVFKVPIDIINKSNQYARHDFELVSLVGTTDIYIDGNEKPIVKEFNVNPMGLGGDFIAFPVVGDLGYEAVKGQKATIHDIRVLNYRLPRNVISEEEHDRTVSGGRAFFTPAETGAPMLRTTFSADKQIANARLYVTARGIYEFYINGKRVGNDFLNPGITQYNKTQFYQTYDVTSDLKQGSNAMGAMLSEGWWSGALSYSPANWNYFGDKQSLLAQLVITYKDGTQQRIVTNPDTWQYSNEGPLLLGSLFQGEVYDATREVQFKGWSTASYDASKWEKANEVALEGTISHEAVNGFFSWPCADDYKHFTLTSQVGMPVRAYTTLRAKSVNEVRPKVYVYDMGQNMAGIPRITFHGLKAGQKVYMRFAEVKYPDLPEYKDNVGMIMMENQRAAMEQDIYIAKGDAEEVFEPHFTYHGYQYVEITGVDAPLAKEDVEGVVLSSVDEISSDYKTNNKSLNRFIENVKWSTLANVFSQPTDCPQRNERMGWSGDLSVFSPTMSYMFNGAQFLRRHLQALRDTQEPDGAFAAIAPVGGGFGGPLWGSVGIAMPYQSYLQYGDIDALREHYPAMQTYVDLMLNSYIDKKENYYRGSTGLADLGDWLGFEVFKNDNSLLFDSYLTYELRIMSQIANTLGKNADAARYEQERQKRIDFINANYFDKQSGMTIGCGLGEEYDAPFVGKRGPKRKGVIIDTQTSYAVPLAFGIVKDDVKDKFVGNFLNSISRRSKGDDGVVYPEYSLMTGFIGTAWISMALSEIGKTDYAYKMLLNKQFPSWLYPVEQGATSIWERLNSYTKKDGFGGNNHMNSFNHYAFGSVTNWLMQRSLGIAEDVASPGFKHFILRPEVDPTGGLSFAEGHYDSMYGRIESKWQTSADAITYHFTIPANTSATVYLPAAKLKNVVLGNGAKLKKLSAVSNLRYENGKAVFELASGSYNFRVEK